MLRSRTIASGKSLETSPPSNRTNFPVPRTGEAKVVPEQVTSRAEHPPDLARGRLPHARSRMKENTVSCDTMPNE
jgi:hypothetical protein